MIYGYETRPENPGNGLQSNPDDEMNGIKRLDHYASGLLSAMAKARYKGEVFDAGSFKHPVYRLTCPTFRNRGGR